MKSRQWHLVARPVGAPTPADFALVTVDLPDPGPGEVLVRNTVLSVDPYMRGRMNDAASYAPPWPLHGPADGGAVGEVLASTVDSHRPGDLVLHMQGWREHALGPAAGFRVIRPQGVPASAYLGALGMPGLTAYAGLFDVAGLQPGETVFVSGAAGAVGSLVGQLAALRGARAIGSAGSPQKVAWLRELGFAAAFCYRDAPVLDQLRRAAPDGIDVYFDNVGGEHLQAAIACLRLHGRAAICGMISQYNAASPQPGPDNLPMLIGKRLTLRGFLVSDHQHLRAEFEEAVGGWIAGGALTLRETVVDGLEQTPAAFVGMLRGDNLGKMLVRLG